MLRTPPRPATFAGPPRRLTPPATELTRPPLTGGLGRGVRWMGPTQVGLQVIRVLTTLLLARLLTPADFGLVALATVVTGFFERVMGDTGTSAALVRRADLTQGLASSVFYWNLAVGTLTWVFFLASAVPLASLLGDVDAAPLVRILGFSALINAASYVHLSMLRRNLQFGRVAAVQIVNAVVTTAATVGLAVAGLGALALAYGTVVGSAAAAVLAWACSPWWPSRYFSRADLSSIRSFSTYLTLQNLFGYVSFAGDRIIVGRLLGVTELGYYGLSNRLLRYPLQLSAQTYREAVNPNLARLQDDDEALCRTYARSVAGIALLLLPVCAVVAAVAEPLVLVGLGEQWVPAAPIVSVIAIVGALQSIATTTGSLYLAKGRADLLFRWSVISSVVLLACYAAGARWGAVGVAYGFLAGITLLMYPAFRIPLALIGARPGVVLRPVLPSVLCAVAAGGVGRGAVVVAERGGAAPLAVLAAGGAAAVVAASVVLGLLRPPALTDVFRVAVPRVRRPRPRPRPRPRRRRRRRDVRRSEVLS